jgi:glycosyltransferase involved in cell wall biosynthesis
MRILIVAFEYPPLNSGGSRRPQRIGRGLHQRGHDVVVWTADYAGTALAAKCDPISTEDAFPVIRIPLKKEDLRFRWHSKGYSFEPDGLWSLWKNGLFTQWQSLIQSPEKPDVILLTVPPFSAFRFAHWVKRDTAIPLVVDMRDHWSLWVMTPYASRIHFKVTQSRERALLSAADEVLVVTSVMRDDLLHAHPALDEKKVHVVTNMLPAVPHQMASPSPKSVRIGYFGAFYYFPQIAQEAAKPWYRRAPYRWGLFYPRREDWKYRSPYFFLKALAEYLEEHPQQRPQIELVFAGAKPSWFDAMIRESGVSDCVTHLGNLSAEKALNEQRKCDYLLLTSVKVEGGSDYCIAGKTFEFFASGKPIIGCVTEGAQRDILVRSGMAVCIDPDDTGASADTLHALFSGKLSLSPDTEFLSQFSEKAVMNQLLEIMQRHHSR